MEVLQALGRVDRKRTDENGGGPSKITIAHPKVLNDKTSPRCAMQEISSEEEPW